MAVMYLFLLLLVSVAQTLGKPLTDEESSDNSALNGRQGYFDSSSGYGGLSSGYFSLSMSHSSYGEPSETVIRPPTRQVTRETQEDQTVEHQRQRQVIHRQRLQQTRSEQTHRHDHHIEKVHKRVINQIFNPHTIVTVNRNHHHHDRNEFVTHVQDINQPIIHKYVRPSQETRRGQTTNTKSEETIEDEKVLTPITRPVQVIKHAPHYSAYGQPHYEQPQTASYSVQPETYRPDLTSSNDDDQASYTPESQEPPPFFDFGFDTVYQVVDGQLLTMDNEPVGDGFTVVGDAEQGAEVHNVADVLIGIIIAGGPASGFHVIPVGVEATHSFGTVKYSTDGFTLVFANGSEVTDGDFVVVDGKVFDGTGVQVGVIHGDEEGEFSIISSGGYNFEYTALFPLFQLGEDGTVLDAEGQQLYGYVYRAEDGAVIDVNGDIRAFLLGDGNVAVDDGDNGGDDDAVVDVGDEAGGDDILVLVPPT